jgi:hypothetical protein
MDKNYIISALPEGIRVIHLPTSISILEGKGTPHQELFNKIMEKIAGCNATKPAITVKHSDLKKVSPNSIYRVFCPACKDGVLPVSRDRETLELLALDRCLLCGQEVIYSDIEDLRKGKL